MKKTWLGVMLAMMMIWMGLGIAEAEARPVTRDELEDFGAKVKALALASKTMNDPGDQGSRAEDGILFRYDFGEVCAGGTELKAETELTAFQIMDPEVTGPREVAVDWDVSQVMEAFPCDNPEMGGTYTRALLYLTGSPEEGFQYGMVERDGQRIYAMEYGTVDPADSSRLAMVLLISGDGVDAIRVEGFGEKTEAEAIREYYEELETLGHSFAYTRVARSLDGTQMEMFQEWDLDFSSLSYQTAVPEIFGDNVEDMMMDNGDGTWLRRVDGEGFSAVFTCDAAGRNANLISYTILSPDLEGPRAVRLGDQFYEDFQRFRSGEGELDETGTTEVLYGTVGEAPYGLAEYGNGDEMILRYVTRTMSGPEVELLLRYEDTVLTEITLHTL